MAGTQKKEVSVMGRLLQRKVHVGECWWYDGFRRKGYGMMRVDGKLDSTHRISWRLWKGDIPDGMKVCHHCDQPPCFNPDHLFLGTQKDNVSDAVHKGRMTMQPAIQAIAKIRRGRTHCVHGHELSLENIRWSKGYRKCRSCDKARWVRE